jgi:hypothetical protein
MKTILIILGVIIAGSHFVMAAGYEATAPAYEVAAYFGDPKFAYWDAVRWIQIESEGDTPVVRQMYLLVRSGGEIRYFEFVSRSPQGASGVLCANLFENDFSHECTVEKSLLVGLHAAFRELTDIRAIPLRLAGTRETVAISTPGSPGVAYSETELKSWNDGFQALRAGMRRKENSSQIGAICAKYWGAADPKKSDVEPVR